MCGRFTLHHSTEDIAERFLVEQTMLELAPRYNIAPSQDIPVVLQRERRTLQTLKWGLVPSWARDPAIGNRMINARSESIAEKPAFRQALRQRRCLLPTSGYYEWMRRGKAKVPHYIHRPDGGLLALAGIWEEWQTPEQGILRTVALITTEPNAFAASIHTRMPALLEGEDEALWLDPSRTNSGDLLPLLRPYEGELAAHPVSAAVNRVSEDSPACIDPVELPPEEPPPPPPPQQLDLF